MRNVEASILLVAAVVMMLGRVPLGTVLLGDWTGTLPLDPRGSKLGRDARHPDWSPHWPVSQLP